MGDEEFNELVSRVEQVREQPWNKPSGRLRKLSLRDAVAITCAYSRQNIIQEVVAEWWDVSQETISQVITEFTPLIEGATTEFRLTERTSVTRGSLLAPGVTGEVVMPATERWSL